MERFENKVLFIKDKEVLFKVIKDIEDSGYSFNYRSPSFFKDGTYLWFGKRSKSFSTDNQKKLHEYEITLEQFTKLLKQE